MSEPTGENLRRVQIESPQHGPIVVKELNSLRNQLDILIAMYVEDVRKV